MTGKEKYELIMKQIDEKPEIMKKMTDAVNAKIVESIAAGTLPQADKCQCSVGLTEDNRVVIAFELFANGVSVCGPMEGAEFAITEHGERLPPVMEGSALRAVIAHEKNIELPKLTKKPRYVQ